MLGDGGWLFTAPSDPLLDGYAPFQVVIRPTGIVYRRPAGGTEMVTGDVLSAVPAPARADSARRAATAPHASPIVSAPSPADEARRADPVARAQELGNRGRVAEALAAAEEAVRQQPSSAEAHYLHALLLAEAGRERDAAATFRRALYFRGDFALAALGLGLTLSRLGDVAAARRALLRARSIVGRLPPDEPVACGEGERAGGVLSTIDVQLACLEERR
jgi:chemotaxis protein methyltransferase CheR